MKFLPFSYPQLQTLAWWCPSSPFSHYDAIICDGAVRSGKTFCMSLSFFTWAMASFHDQQFALCGKTVSALRRNLLSPLLPLLRSFGFLCVESLSRNCLTVRFAGHRNTFYLFGGRDESSHALIQGATFAGVLLDEVVLMPRSFVDQACARCSVPGSRIWFNCNPQSPSHWFYQHWILHARDRNALYLHFSLDDNPALSPTVRQRYQRLYSGVFYRRFILGQWVAAQGRIYDFFDDSFVCPPPEGPFDQWVVSCDYGTVNPASFGLWGLRGGIWYRLREFYFDARREGFQKTDADYVQDLLRLTDGLPLSAVVVDPSAASFIEALRRQGLPVRKAVNDVLSGIRITADLLKSRQIVICSSCADAIREFDLYSWDDAALGRDIPIKENDHAMDDIRYFAATIVHPHDDPFAALWVER
ncbi:MAG: PBSX family phage terminase large subunit [Eubacteriales bacterium]|nr:PBSX family phage terminase large subunit [Eubacteriales bacterium]